MSFAGCRKGDLGTVLNLVERGGLSSIYFVEIGLNHNNIRIEFEKTGYCFLLRDAEVGRLLHAKFSGKSYQYSNV